MLPIKSKTYPCKLKTAVAEKHSCEIAIRCDWIFEMNTECMAGAGGLISYLYLIMA